jgi:hypothetical protein
MGWIATDIIVSSDEGETVHHKAQCLSDMISNSKREIRTIGQLSPGKWHRVVGYRFTEVSKEHTIFFFMGKIKPNCKSARSRQQPQPCRQFPTGFLCSFLLYSENSAYVPPKRRLTCGISWWCSPYDNILVYTYENLTLKYNRVEFSKIFILMYLSTNFAFHRNSSASCCGFNAVIYLQSVESIVSKM